ncbi:MAG TPA: hypothetical protein DEB06_00345, partial [Phycisphaerales bacterium]|nr:hypothetical protein [Phycisphaerales bacterium]
QYWDWSRRPDLSYYSKGPGIAWLIALSTRVFSDSEWAIRLPAALSMGLAALACAAMVQRASPRAPMAALHGAGVFLTIPAFHATALFMTIDPPLIACWTLAACCTYAMLDRASTGRPSIALWVALGLALGLGFLFKYTALLLIPGLALAWWNRRAEARPDARTPARAALALAVFILLASPVLLWNQRHGWPTVAHLLGHLGAPGGDSPRAGTG